MSGPVTDADAPTATLQADHDAPPRTFELTDSRSTDVGRMHVRRALPRRGRRTVGAWCFVDHMGPAAVTEDEGVDIGPHPHIGLQTVTWLVAGEVLHRDSLGSEQVIRPGQLNLMTAGGGVVHAEEHTGRYRGDLHGVQLWVAQPEATRHGPPAFEHHAELPRVALDNGDATVLVGRLADHESPARRDTEHVGVDLALRPGATTVPLAAHFEHALVVLQGSVEVDGHVVEPGRLAYLGTDRDEVGAVVGTGTDTARVLLIGGVPFPEPVLMWWNFVARTRAEIVEAHTDWMGENDRRFGTVASSLPRVPVGPPPWSPDRGT